MGDIRSRMGRFLISREVINADPKAVQKVLSKVIVVRCESHFISNSLEYIALSERFEKVTEGMEAPLYIPVIKNGFVSFEQVK